jgi:predicted Holliday junction resolvase-like endonuclease
MTTTAMAKQIIRTLETGGFYAECPCCGETMALKDVGLFHLDRFTPEALEVYRGKLDELAERRRALRLAKKAIPKTSQVTAQAVNIGYILERIAPVLDAFRFEHNDCRALFDPIDYIVFQGLRAKGKVDAITFVDIKTGAAQLTGKQKQIRDLVNEGRVEWDTYSPEEGS